MRLTHIIILAITLACGFIAITSADQAALQPTSVDCTDIDLLPELTGEEARSIALQAWDSGLDSTLSLKEILGPAVDLIRSIATYVAHHPWILLGFIIPALELWIPLVGFQAGGVAAGSIAAAIQAKIGNIPKGSMFAFLQSYGAGGFARTAMRLGGGWVVVALMLAAVGKLLLENEVSTETVVGIVERVWNSTVAQPPSQEDFLSRYALGL